MPDYGVHPIGQENQKSLSLLMQMPLQVVSGRKKSLPTTANPQYQISLWKNIILMVKVLRLLPTLISILTRLGRLIPWPTNSTSLTSGKQTKNLLSPSSRLVSPIFSLPSKWRHQHRLSPSGWIHAPRHTLQISSSRPRDPSRAPHTYQG
jgi:hypothetical protein